jgi:AraC-like DNA-binding protein
MSPYEERARSNDNASFPYWMRDDKSFDFSWHHHSAYELTLILKGKGKRFIGDSIESYYAGDLVLLGPNLPHTWVSDSEDGKPQQAIVAQFHLEDLGNWKELVTIQHLLESSVRGLHFHPETVHTVATIFLDGVKMKGIKKILALLQTLDLLSEARSGSPISFSPSFVKKTAASKLRDERMNIILRHLDKSNDLPLAAAAAMVGLSKEGFSRWFKRVTNRTYTQYLQELRIGQACHLLSGTNQPITQLAFEVGFNNLAHFNRVFLKRKGCTPSIWRKNYRNHQ